MSAPLCAIGGAILEAVGLAPVSFGYRSESRWAAQPVFGGDVYYQPTGLGERIMPLRLAARPHVMGGLLQYRILKAHHEAQDVVPYIRLTAALVGDVGPNVAIRRLSHNEEKIAPDGTGRRWEFDVELLLVGDQAGGFS